MSLALAAKHLESQGRGGDSHLVHMTSGEVNALNELAKAHGGHLTINPKTGLAEAGLLSSILPTVAGIALGAVTGDPFLAAALVGGADFALTGSLGQGIMAGLGAWSGAGLQADLAKIAPGVQTGVDTGSSIFNAESARALDSTLNPFQAVTGQTGDLTSGFANEAASVDAFPTTPVAAPPIPQDPNSLIKPINTNFNPQQVPGSFPQGTPTPSFSPGAAAPTGLDASWQGAQKLMNDPSSRMPFWQENKWDVVGVGMPVAKGIMQEMQPDPYKAPDKEKNPFHLKTLDPNFKGSFPTQPNPYPQAQYRDYVTNPYTSYAAGGGLQSIHKYAGASDSMTAIGKHLLKQSKYEDAPIAPGDPNAKYDPSYYEGTSGITANKWGRDYDNMSSDKLAQHILDSAKNLGKAASRPSVMMQDPAQTSMASIQSETPATTVKEGGLMHYALGGLSMGHLGGYSDGGRLLKGPGDGVSDSIPASIGNKQPARLAEGEFVIPARIVSELGNGSTDAGAKRLYAMMDRIKAKRAKSKDIAADTKTYNLLPA